MVTKLKPPAPPIVPITSFFGTYRFLSNFWPCPVEYAGLRYCSAEAAYPPWTMLLMLVRSGLLIGVSEGLANDD